MTRKTRCLGGSDNLNIRISGVLSLSEFSEMQSVLISSKDKVKGREEAEKIFKNLKINKFDITILEYEKAVGIQDVRQIQQKIHLKPLKSDIRAVLIDATLGITIEAQNALLKTLEEAPDATLIIVQVLNADEILPTILSRCKVIELKNKIEQNSSASAYLNILISDRLGDKLKLAQDLSKDKNEALDFLESLIIDLRKDLVLNYKSVKRVQQFHTTIKNTNVNLRLALENLFLNL